MRFVLKSIDGETATLYTRTTNKEFKTRVSDLIFIKTDYNKQKAERLEKKYKKDLDI